jgi:hypothetical protein
MKKVIELLEQAKKSLDGAASWMKVLESVSGASKFINKALAELKAPPICKGEGGRRVRCNWCESVFDEEHIRVIDDTEYCPVCEKTGYLMDLPEAESKPRWETPEQREKRTGEKYPDGALVWSVSKYAIIEKPTKYNRLHWWVGIYKEAKDNKVVEIILCAYNHLGPPPDDWRPEEGKEQNDK